MKNFADKVIEMIKLRGNPICVGLDPRPEKIPNFIFENLRKQEDFTPLALASEAIFTFNRAIIDQIADLVPVVKPQMAFYEVYGSDGVKAYERTLNYAKSKGLLTIADAKRNDIGSTAEAYARSFLGEVELFEGDEEVVLPVFDADSLTVNPYLGWDSVKPFVEECRKYEKGIFILVKTSNAGSADIQDLVVRDAGYLHEVVAYLVDSWGANEIGERGYSFVGAVVGATFPEQAKKLRHIMPNSIFLVPGYGAQGAKAEDVLPCFNSDGLGALINSSREIIFAYEKSERFGPKDFAYCAREAVLQMAKDLKKVL